MKSKKMKDEGKNDFKVIYGIEAYVHPDLDQWRIDKEKIKEDTKLAKQIDDDVGLVVENESETKKGIKNALNQRSHLVLNAINQKGLNNLFNLVSTSYRGDNFYRFPRIDYGMLAKHSEGIIASSACIGGILGNDYWRNRDMGDPSVLAAMEKTVEAMMNIFGDRFYGELQWANYKEQHIINQFIIQLSKVHGFQLISTCDAHFPSPDMWKDREIYKMLGWMNKSEVNLNMLPSKLEEMEYQLYPKNGDELFASYKLFSSNLGFHYDDKLVEESIARTSDILRNRIENYTPDTNIKLPNFVVPEGETADSALAKLAITNLKNSGLYMEQEYVDRLKEELHTIKDRGFSKYFLTMQKIASDAKETQLCGAGRGSGAGSLVSYLLNITEVDPIKYKLQFSRFIRKTDKSGGYPDIDFDVGDRAEFVNTMIKKYGDNTVVPISNYNTLQIRSLVKDISKLYGIEFQKVNEVTSKMINEALPDCKKDHGITAGVYNPTWEELKKYSPSLNTFLQEYPDVAIHIETLQGQIRSISRHAGGVLFADNLNQNMPLINSGGTIQTPWTEGQTVRHLEPLGFIKFDILALASLRMIETAIEHILKNVHGIENPTFQQVKEYYNEKLHPSKIDLDDQSVYENIFQKGKFVGTFQFTNDGAQNFCKLANPKNVVDISAITSIYRPGPLSANVDKKYIEAKNNPHNIKYIHPLVEEVTRDTFGFIIFQEQLSLLAHKLGRDISLDEGNELRKVLTKKGTGKEAEVKNKLYSKFIGGCADKGISEEDANDLWKTMEFFSGYGFNLAHAVCYSILSYQCAWLLNYYPAEWCCAFLDKEPEERKEEAISLVKSIGFKVRNLDINKSGVKWEVDTLDRETLIQPLSSIKGLGDVAIAEIITNRPFKDVESLLFNDNIKYNKLNKRSLDVLCRSDALRPLIDDRFSGSKHFWSVVAVDRPKTLKKFKENIELYKPEGEFSDEEKIENIVALSGVYPLNLVMSNELLSKLKDKNIQPIGTDEDSKTPFSWFVPRKKEVKTTKNGKPYWILEVTDNTNTITEIKCWGIRDTDFVHMNKPYLAKVSKDSYGYSIRNFRDDVRLLT